MNMDISDVMVDLKRLESKENQPYQGREITATLQANTEAELDILVSDLHDFADDNGLERFSVLSKGPDEDFGWKAVITSHNWNPLDWAKSKFGKEKTDEDIYAEAEKKAKDEELKAEKKAQEEALKIEQKAAEEQAKQAREVVKETARKAEQEKQRIAESQRIIQRATAHEASVGERKAKISAVGARITEIPTAAIGKVVGFAAKPFGESEDIKQERLDKELAALTIQQRTAARQIQKRKMQTEIKLASQISSGGSGNVGKTLETGFMGEYAKVSRYIREGRAKPEDVYVIRQLLNEARMYGVDENLLSEITKYRRTIEGNKIVRGAGQAIESASKLVTGAVSRAGGIHMERVLGGPSSVTSVPGAASGQPMRKSSPFGLSESARQILGVK